MMLSVRADKLAEKRKEMNLSQYRLSILSGLSGNSVFRMETQRHKISDLRAKAIADTLNCNVTELFYTDK